MYEKRYRLPFGPAAAVRLVNVQRRAERRTFSYEGNKEPGKIVEIFVENVKKL